MKNLILLIALLAFVAGTAEAQTTTWNDGAGDSSWSNAANWSNGVPTTGSAVQIGTMQNGDTVIYDDTSTVSLDDDNSTLSSLGFNNTLTTTTQIVPLNPETITVDGGGITNSDSHQQQIEVPVISGANATYAGGTGGLLLGSLHIGTQNILTSGSVSISDGNLFLDIDSSTSYGTIGPINVSGADITIGGTYTGNAGDIFQLTNGNFTGAMLNHLPTLSPGLSWNTALFDSNGELIVVPEPSTTSLLALAALGLIVVCRRCVRKS